MNKKTLTLAAAVAAVLAAGGLGATSHAGKTTEERYNAYLDRTLAELPFLKVEKRSYERGFLGADARLALRLDLPAPTSATADEEDEEDEAEEENAENAGGEARDGRASASPHTPKVRPRAVVIAFHDRITHGPFPGSLKPAAARLASTVDLAIETDDGKASAPLTVLTSDTLLDFADGFSSRFASPAGEWAPGDGKARVVWSGLTGESSGNLKSLQGRYAMTSPGMTLRATDERQQPVEMVIGATTVNGHTDPTPSLLSAPGKVRVLMSSMRMAAHSPDGKPFTLAFSDLDGETNTTRNGDLLDIRTTFGGKGQVDKWQIDRIEMVEQWRRLHAQSFDAMIRNVYASLGKPGEEDADPAALMAPLMADLKGFLPHDPEYAMEKLNLTVDGRTAEFGWRFALKGATADAIENPMLLAKVATAGLDAKLPRQWIEALLERSGEMNPVVDVDRISGLLAQGQQMGLVVVEKDLISTRVRFADGGLEVNGRNVFQLPASR